MPPTYADPTAQAEKRLAIAGLPLGPARHVGTGSEADGARQLARRTCRLQLGSTQIGGLGQRVLATDQAEGGLLELRSAVIAAV